MNRLCDITVVCLKGQPEEPGDRPPVMPDDPTLPLDAMFKAVVESNHFAGRIEALPKLTHRGEKLLGAVRLNEGYMDRVKNRPGQEGMIEEPGPIKRPPPPHFEIFCMLWSWLEDLEFVERANAYYWACTLADLVRSNKISDGCKAVLLDRCGVVLEQDHLLDGLAAVLAKQSAGNPRDALEVECYKAVLDFVFFSLTDQIRRSLVKTLPDNGPAPDRSKRG